MVGASAYMEWAKKRPAAAIDLVSSDLLPCSIEDLLGALEAIDLGGHGPNGYAPLLEAISERYGVTPERVATAGGCSGANFLAFAALIEAGDDILFERPVYDPLTAAARLLNANVRFFDRRFEEGYAIDADRVRQAMTERTRLIVFSNPHNPSGALVSEEDLAAIARIAEKARALVLVDEVYQDAILSGRQPPAATRSPVFVSTNSLTKAYGLSSLRAGWALATPEITERIRRARDIVDNYGPVSADRLAVVAFRHLDRLAERARAIIEPNKRIADTFFAGRADLEVAQSRSIVAFPRLSNESDAAPFVRRLFRRHGVAVVPGSFFGSPAHFRLSFGGSTASLQEGLDAIERCLDASAR